jgi:predicted nuclease of predicted toxin-antitoxin system
VNILIDMNLSPDWEEVFKQAGFNSKHWSQVGSPCASDVEIMEYARKEDMVVFTHDLDFSALLYSTGAMKPSVIQLRSEDTRPTMMGSILISAIGQAEDHLISGALVTVDPRKNRITLLPLKAEQ